MLGHVPGVNLIGAIRFETRQGRNVLVTIGSDLAIAVDIHVTFLVENPAAEVKFHFAKIKRVNFPAISAGRANWPRNTKSFCMINPTGDEFNEEVPTGASADVGAFQTSNRGMTGTASNAWEQTKEKAGAARERTEIFVRSNPIPILLSALGIGIAIGLAIRYASSAAERKIEPEEKLSDGVLGFLSLPFLWPFLKSVREKAEDSADALKEGVDRLKNVKVSRYTKPMRKRWKAWSK
jgi:hypothetical protein